jgi:hypothetical protein
MNKYIIEDNISFFEELKNTNTKTNNIFDNDKICLITNDLLDTENCVKLDCGHNFNYLPILNELLNQKFFLYNKYDLKHFNCPYCRDKFNLILPYKENIFNIMIYGINTLNKEYYIHTNNLKLNVIEKCHNSSCNKLATCCFYKKKYCFTHHLQKKTKIIKQEEKQQEEKKQEEKQQEEKKQEEKKQEEKQQEEKKQEDKQEEKQEDKQQIITPNLQQNTCKAILKTGINKGNQCKNKVLESNHLFCKRHKNNINLK